MLCVAVGYFVLRAPSDEADLTVGLKPPSEEPVEVENPTSDTTDTSDLVFSDQKVTNFGEQDGISMIARVLVPCLVLAGIGFLAYRFIKGRARPDEPQFARAGGKLAPGDPPRRRRRRRRVRHESYESSERVPRY